MTLLIISPDYASHATPLVTIGRAWRDAGERVVVATGPAVAPLVVGAGMEFERLSLGRGFNAGVARPDDSRGARTRTCEPSSRRRGAA